VPAAALSFDLGYSYVHAEYTDFDVANGTGGFFDYTDRKFAGVPKHQFNATVNFTPIADDQTGKVTLSGSYTYRSSFFINKLFQTGAQVRTQAGFSPALVSAIPDHPAGVSIPGVGLFNGRIAWENVMGTRFGVALYGKNLANKLYANSGLSLCESLGTITNTYGDPRTYGIEVSFRF